MNKQHISSLDYFFLSVVVFALVYQLFISPIVGLGNSGDQQRVMGWAGLSYQSKDPSYAHYQFVYKKYLRTGHLEAQYPSSELVFLGIALVSNSIAFHDGLFDIRSMGLAHSIGLLVGLLVFMRYAKTLRRWTRIVVYGFVAVMFLDVGYTAYFNSFFCEPSTFVYLITTISFALLASGQKCTGKQASCIRFGFFLFAALFVTLKFQNSLLGIPLAILGYKLFGSKPREISSSKRWQVGTVVASLGLGLLVIGYFGIYLLVPNSYRGANLYNSVFYEILGHSESPEADLVELGLDPNMAYLAGTSPWDGGGAKLTNALPNQISFKKIIGFYLRHPARFVGLVERASEKVFTMRPLFLGSLERPRSMPENAHIELLPYGDLPDELQSKAFSLSSSLLDYVNPRSLSILVAFFLINIGVIGLKMWKLDRHEQQRLLSHIHLTLLVMAALEFLTVVIGDGEFEIGKHYFVFNLICQICFLFIVGYLSNMIAAQVSSRRANKDKKAEHAVARVNDFGCELPL